MNKTLESLLQRAADWPAAAQEEAAVALVEIEQRVTQLRSLTPDERAARMADLRATIRRSVEGGGSHTDEEVAASIAERLDAWEREGPQG